MGYRTNDPESLTYEQDQRDAMAVAERMKETGWQFAVHGWGHRHIAQISYDSLVTDTNRWKAEVGALIETINAATLNFCNLLFSII